MSIAEMNNTNTNTNTEAPEQSRTGCIDSHDLREMIDAVLPFTDPGSLRYAITGVKIESADGELHFIATDGRKLAHVWEEWTGGNGIDCVANAKGLKTVRGKLGNGKKRFAVRITFARDAIHFIFDGKEIAVPLVEGRFPQWRFVVPQAGSETCKAFVQCERLQLMCDALEPARSGGKRIATFRLHSGGITATAGNDDELGSVNVSTNCICEGSALDKEPFRIAFDPALLGEIPRAIPYAEQTLEWRIAGADRAAVLSWRKMEFVIMPLSLDR